MEFLTLVKFCAFGSILFQVLDIVSTMNIRGIYNKV